MRIGILTSGGDAPGMNACIRSTTRMAIQKGYEVIGFNRGFKGILDEDFQKLTRWSVADILQRGGTFLRTARCEEFRTKKGVDLAYKNLKKMDIDSLIIIGGDGSFKGGLELHKRGVHVIGIPATIDNDLGYTDYTIGFDTAVNTVLSAIGNIRDTASAHERTTIIEVMGRDAGYIALDSGIAGGADVILIPEKSVSIEEICKKIIMGREIGKLHSIIVKAEGTDLSIDDIEKGIAENIGREVKHVILGYLQRGGTPTAKDRVLGTKMGVLAVSEIAKDESVVIGEKEGNIISFNIDEALKLKKNIDFNLLSVADLLAK